MSNTVSKYEIQRCNNWLKEKYGEDIYGQHWRLVWSKDQREVRHGTFTNFDNSGNFLSTVTEDREVDKYPWLPACWILETKSIYEGNEIKNHNGYDILYPFVDKNNHRVDPDLEAIQWMFEVCLFHVRKTVTTPEKAAQAEEDRFDRDVEEIERGLSE